MSITNIIDKRDIKMNQSQLDKSISDIILNLSYVGRYDLNSSDAEVFLQTLRTRADVDFFAYVYLYNLKCVFESLSLHLVNTDKSIVPSFIKNIYSNLERMLLSEYNLGLFRSVNLVLNYPTDRVDVDSLPYLLNNMCSDYNFNIKVNNSFETIVSFIYKFLRISPFDCDNVAIGIYLLNYLLLNNGFNTVIIPIQEYEKFSESLNDLQSFKSFLERMYISTLEKVGIIEDVSDLWE